MLPRHSCGTRTVAGASGDAFIALSRREVRTEYVERPFKVRQTFADLGAFPSCLGKARVDPVIEPTEPGAHRCSGGDTDGDDSDQRGRPDDVFTMAAAVVALSVGAALVP